MGSLIDRLMGSAVYAPDGDGNGEGGEGGDAAAVAAAAAEKKAAEEAAAATAAATAAEKEAAAKAEAEKVAAEKAAAEKAEAEKKAAATNWRDTITDKNLKNVADRLASPADAIKSIVDLRTKLSNAVVLPGENSTDEEKANYRKALGVPDKPEGYDIKPPEGIEVSEIDKAIIEMALPIAVESGVPKGAMQSLMAGVLKMNDDLRKSATQAIADFQKESDDALHKEWGNDYDPNMNLAKRFVEVYAGGDFKEFLNTTKIEGGGMIGDHPVMAKLLATLGRRTDEGDLLLGATPEEKASVQEQIDKLNKEVPVGSPGYTNPVHQTKLQKLYEQVSGNRNIVGAAGRAA